MTDGQEEPDLALSQRFHLQELLARREDIAVYPSDALNSAVPPKKEEFYFYRPGELLVPRAKLEPFEAAAAEISLRYCIAAQSQAKANQEAASEPPAEAPRTTAEASESGPPSPGEGEEQQPEPPVLVFVRSAFVLDELLQRLEAASKDPLGVTPNHVLFASQFWGMDPYGDPTPAANLPLAGGPTDGVPVAVIDSGLPDGYQANALLNPVAVGNPALDFENGDYRGGPPLQYPQGHGSFVAGVVRKVAQGASVTSYRALDDDGVVDEVDLAAVVARALLAKPMVLNLSMGTYTRQGLSLLTLNQLAWAATRQNVIVIAAAGNLARCPEFFPAAEGWAIGVGAAQLVNGRAVKSCFTNFGPWVDVCAAGVNVVSAYEDRQYDTKYPPGTVLTFHGCATWSGTSFAAPHVSGVVANMLATTPRLNRNAVLTNLKTGAQAVPDLGSYVK